MGWLLAACQATPTPTLTPVPVLGLEMTIKATAVSEFVRPTAHNTLLPPVIYISTLTAPPTHTPPSATEQLRLVSPTTTPPLIPTFEPTLTPYVYAPSPTPAVCKYEWFYPSPGSICPYSTPLASYAVIQPFEHGQMIWVEETDRFYIMFEAGAHPSLGSQTYLAYSNIQLRPGASVDNRVGEPPPAGLYEPVSGFGLLWRNEIEGADLPFLRSSLGWATKPEEGFQTMYQCTDTFYFSCYLSTSSHSVIGFYWSLYVGTSWSEFTW